MRYVTNPKGEKIVIARSAEVMITDDHGRERERHKVPYGATLRADDGKPSRPALNWPLWDPHTRPIVTEVCRYGEVRERRGRRDRRQADR
jgi:DNA-directed RNA polymerase subunit beta'